MAKDNIIKFPDKKGRSLPRKTILKNRIRELESENDMLNYDLEALSYQLDENLAEIREILYELQEIIQEELATELVEFKSDFGVDISFLADFDLEEEPEE